MLPRTERPQASTPVELYVKKFHSLFEMHRVTYGSPEDLSAFLEKLRGDRHLAMDFWALAAAISQEQGGDPPKEQMLDLIVRSITALDAEPLRESSRELKQCVEHLERLLAGEDIDRDDAVPSGEQSAAAERSVEAPSSATPLESTTNRLNEALLRLELNTLELKQHLDKIDDRIHRLEPHLEQLASKAAPVPQQPPSVHEQPHEPLEQEQPLPQRRTLQASENARLVLRSADSLPEDDDDPSIFIPLAGYAAQQRTPTRGLIPLCAALLLAAGGIFFAQRHDSTSQMLQYGAALRDTARQKYGDFSRELRDLRDHGANADAHAAREANATNLPAKDNNASAAVTGTPTPALPTNGSTPPPQKSNETQASTAPAEKSVPPPKTASVPPTTKKAAAPSAPSSRPAHANRTSAVASADRDVTLPGYNPSEAPVSVPPAVMQENLVTSRVPAYPAAAKAEDIQGPVIMQAIITRNGTVGHLHVLQGDPMLRSAASEAVSRWRYRPYTVNGRPVDVATTIRVDFKLPRR